MRLVRHYSDFLNAVTALAGIETLMTPEATTLNALFNTATQEVWNRAPWLETSPRGEARFAGNRLTYPNNLTKTANWTATAVTLTANSVANPADGAVTASKMMETAANSAHKVVQTVTTFYPSTGYTVSFYGRPNGRSYVQLAVSDGVTTYSAFFNLVAGTVGTTSNFTTSTIGQQPNGFWLCQCTFTADAAATTSGTCTLSLSSDGSTLSYAGDTAKGAYIWGILVQQTTNVPINDSTIAWAQTGENAIDSVYGVYGTSPFSASYPPSLGHDITPDGIQLINSTPNAQTYYVNGYAQTTVYGSCPANPVFLYYRKTCPNYTGDEYSATDTYAVDEQVYFEDSSGVGDFYKCLVATSAGQSPTTTPTSWEVIPVYDTFLPYCTYKAFADWLVQDGQQDKAAQMYAIAEDKMFWQHDKIERQMGTVMPMQVATNLTSRSNY